MSIKIRTANDWDKTIRMPEVKSVLDVTNPIGAAVAGAVIRDTGNGTMENMANYQAVNESFTVRAEQGPVVVGQKTITVLTDKNGTAEHRLESPEMVKVYLTQGFTIKETIVENIMSG